MTKSRLKRLVIRMKTMIFVSIIYHIIYYLKYNSAIYRLFERKLVAKI